MTPMVAAMSKKTKLRVKANSAPAKTISRSQHQHLPPSDRSADVVIQSEMRVSPMSVRVNKRPISSPSIPTRQIEHQDDRQEPVAKSLTILVAKEDVRLWAGCSEFQAGKRRGFHAFPHAPIVAWSSSCRSFRIPTSGSRI